MRERLAGMKTGASNRQVAEILDSKKGTIDAHLAAVKAKWKQ
jgi:DNA-binding CsgD family transcriptional regulator